MPKVSPLSYSHNPQPHYSENSSKSSQVPRIPLNNLSPQGRSSQANLLRHCSASSRCRISRIDTDSLGSGAIIRAANSITQCPASRVVSMVLSGFHQASSLQTSTSAENTSFSSEDSHSVAASEREGVGEHMVEA